MEIKLKLKFKINDIVYAMYDNKVYRFLIDRIMYNGEISNAEAQKLPSVNFHCVFLEENGAISGSSTWFKEESLYKSKSAILKTL